MKAKSRKSSAPTASLVLVGAPSPGVDRKHALLRDHGFDVTRADSICHAEVFSESQYFEVAVYDEGLSAEEQISLARVMRVRWPWMRLVRCGHSPLHSEHTSLFDGTAVSEAQLPQCVDRTLGR